MTLTEQIVFSLDNSWNGNEEGTWYYPRSMVDSGVCPSGLKESLKHKKDFVLKHG